MSVSASKLVVPAYVLLCLVFGGSNHGIWFSAVLQIFAVLLIGLLVLTTKKRDVPTSSRALILLFVASVLIVLLQLVPLPHGLWTALPGRGPIQEGYEAMGLPLPWLPLSMTPYDTLDALFYALPFLAVLLGTMLFGRMQPRWTVAALIVGTIAGVGLGALQTTGGESWKIYSITNTGAVGFFANRNFLGTLLLMNIPFAVAIMGASGPANRNMGMTFKVVGTAYLLFILIGIILNRSLAAALIAVPVSLASIALLPLKLSWKWYAVGFAMILAGGITFLLAGGALRSEVLGGDAVSIQTRTAIWAQTLRIAADTFPFGTGLGSFREIYAFYEDPALVNHWYVNNAHSDYLELLLETGLPGLLLIIGFFGWWFVQARKVWRASQVNLIARAATIASAAVLAHSMVDYPLRTAAISSVFAFCLGVMATFGTETSGHPQRRGVRHMRIA
jgi:O-antigen ligase